MCVRVHAHRAWGMGMAHGLWVEMETTGIYHRDLPFIKRLFTFRFFFFFLLSVCFLSLVSFANHVHLSISLPLNLCCPVW